MDVWRDCDEARVLDEGMDEVNVRCERVDIWSDCDEVRLLDEGMDEVNVSEWMYGGIVIRRGCSMRAWMR